MPSPRSDPEKSKNQVVVLKSTGALWYSKKAKNGKCAWHQMTKYSRDPIVLKWLKQKKAKKMKTVL